MKPQIFTIASGKENEKVPLENVVWETHNKDVDQKTSITKPGYIWYRDRYRQYQILFGSLLIILLIKIIWVMLLSYKSQYYSIMDVKRSYPDDSENAALTDTRTNFTSLEGLKIASRGDWQAQPPLDFIRLALPAPYVIISHTATKNCSNTSACSSYVRAIQLFHQETRHWDDIAYNFLVGGDGLVYEGTGWRFEGAHIYGYNSRSMGIAFIGNFEKDMPPKRQITAAKQLIQMGVAEGYIDPNYKLLGARQLVSTASPGLQLYKNMTTWPHWAKNP